MKKITDPVEILTKFLSNFNKIFEKLKIIRKCFKRHKENNVKNTERRNFRKFWSNSKF